MAIALDITSQSGWAAQVNGWGWSHTCTGSNLVLNVNIFVAQGVGDVVTGCKYNGVSMTLIGKRAAGSAEVYSFRLVNPTTGTNTIAVTTSSAVECGNAASYTGVDQVTPIDSSATSNSTASTTLTAATTVVASNCWLVGACIDEGSGVSGNLTSNRTDREKIATVTITNAILSDSNAIVATGSQSFVFTGNSSFSNSMSAVVFSLTPFTAAPVNARFLAFM